MSVWSAFVLAAAMAAAEPAAGRLTLDLVDQHGAVLPSVEITLVGPASRQTKTDDHGRALFRDLPAGSYRLAATLLGFVSESREVIVRAGAPAVLKIEFWNEFSTDPHSGKPVRHTMTVHCSNLASRSIESAWRAADVVARVRIDRKTVFDHWQLRKDAFPIVTVHEARVLEHFKTDPRLQPGANAIAVVHEVGTIERPQLIETSTAPGSDLLHADREYVVFLHWSDRWQAWTIDACDSGSFEIDAEASPDGQGQPTSERLETLRGMKHAG
jgi:hypothetical protein